MYQKNLRYCFIKVMIDITCNQTEHHAFQIKKMVF